MADLSDEENLSYFPDDFKKYMYKELNWLPSEHFDGGVFWSREDDKPQRPSTLPNGDISNLNKIIRDLLYITRDDWPDGPILVQFWAPITTKEGRSFLTTRNKPFSLISFHGRFGIEGLCEYRMICMDSKFDIDLDGGKTCEQHLPGRVFKHQFPESTPNVELYSITEYPQRDDALRCGVLESLAFPIFESSTQRCVGVIEVVSPVEDCRLLICRSYSRYEIYKDFEKFGLICSFAFPHEDAELDDNKNEARKVAFDEIKNVLKRVCDVHDVPFAQAWVPCKMGCPCRALVDGGILHASCYYKKDDYGEDEDEDEDDFGVDVDDFRHISSLVHLRNGVGVVGRALLSTNMVFCRDVTQLSLTEYPLAHYAQKAGLSGCFAICLESNYTGNDVYVLEVFMPMSNNASENPHTSLRKILETMRKKFRCLRVASRELLEKLHIEEISIQNGEKLDLVQIPQATISLPQLELSQSEVEVMQVDSLDQQLVNAINTGSNVGGTEHNNFAITSETTVKVSKRKGNKSEGTVKTAKRDGNYRRVKIKIPVEDILQNSKLTLQKAAERLQVSISTLKRACRGYGIKSWPPCTIDEAGCSDQVQILQLNSDHPPSIQALATTVHTKPHDSSQLNESAPCVHREQIVHLNSDHLPSTQVLATIEPHDTMMQDAKDVTVEATFGEITMRFYLSLSSSFVEFQEEVSKRRPNLVAGTYDVIYVDEGKRVLISTDADLQDYMRRSRSPGQTSIEVFILPTWQSAAPTEEIDWMQLLNVDQQNSHTIL